MPFTSETAKLHRGPGGRRKKAEVEAKKAAAELVKELLDANAARLGNRYITRALGKNADKVLIHAIDKLLPDEQHENPAPTQINFVQYNYTAQLPPEDVSATVLASNGDGNKAGLPRLASPVGQGQNGIKFHNFEDVS